MLKKNTRLFFPAAGLFLGIAGFFLSVKISDYFFIKNSQTYLINPLAETRKRLNTLTFEYMPFGDKIRRLNDLLIKDGLAGSISVYFRDLDNGWWFGINENDFFYPMSLLKVPIMIAWLKFDEIKPGVLDDIIVFSDADREIILASKTDNNYSAHLDPDGSYSVWDLIKAMILFSDNTAADILHRNIEKKFLNQVYRDLGINNEDDIFRISLKRYSVFFRILYNASYLNITNSHKALRLLTKADFNRGIRRAMPPDITISHKYGIRSSDQNSKELHHVAIVYYPGKPFLLGIMTRGKEISKLYFVIETIADLIYREVNAQVQYKKNNSYTDLSEGDIF
ncbi:MAG: hypothetical protein A2096_14400 [Spirochaetes bacterium GWF1_41_5]|nr:MAG: hypothetical protein A2096_14400 [Spirochaetes bacterium GWF1_41_5]